jgi:hypothetical protein
MVGYSDVMRRGRIASEPHVTTGLAYNAITQLTESFGKLPRSRRGAASCRDDLLAHEMKPDKLWRRSVVEMAAHSIADLLAESLEIIRLSKDRMPQCSRREPSFGRFLHGEDNLVHGWFLAANKDDSMLRPPRAH